MNNDKLLRIPRGSLFIINGRVCRYWGKVPMRAKIDGHDINVVYCFFDVETDQCHELYFEQVLNLKRAPISNQPRFAAF